MIDPAALFYPAIRWDAERGFESQHDAIDAALALGVGGFILFGGPAEHVTALTERLHSHSTRRLLIGADLERGPGQQFAGATALPPSPRSARSIPSLTSAAPAPSPPAKRGVSASIGSTRPTAISTSNQTIRSSARARLEAIPRQSPHLQLRGSTAARRRKRWPAPNIFRVTAARRPTRTPSSRG